MVSCGPPIASGYRGSRRIATLEDFYGPAEQKIRKKITKKEVQRNMVGPHMRQPI